MTWLDGERGVRWRCERSPLKARVRRIYFQKIITGTNANLQNFRLWRPIKPGKQIPQDQPPCPKPPMLALEQCVLMGITLLH